MLKWMLGFVLALLVDARGAHALSCRGSGLAPSELEVWAAPYYEQRYDRLPKGFVSL